jgi:hypothetical protein
MAGVPGQAEDDLAGKKVAKKEEITMRFKNTWRWFEIGLIILSTLVHLYIASLPTDSLMKWYASDDGFYYFKVAVNITNGLGVTFDGISRTNGFHPLWMLVCIPVFALAHFNLILPLRLLVLVSALLNAGTAVLIFRLLRKFITPWTAAAMGIFWVFLPTIHTTVAQYGLESTISSFFLALLFYMVVERWDKRPGLWKLISLGVVAGLAILARLDNIFVVMLLGVWFVFGFASKYLRTLVVGDLALIYIVGLLGYYFRLPAGPAYVAHSVSLPWHLALVFATLPLSLFLFGLYRPDAERLSWKFLARCGLAVALASGITGACLLVFQKVGLFQALPRSVIILVFLGNLLCVIGLRLLAGAVFRGETILEKISLRSWGFWKGLVPRAVGYFVPLGLLLGIYMMWSYLYVGTPMPISGQIKHWWGGMSTVYGTAHHTLPELLSIEGSLSAWKLAFSPMQFLGKFGGTLSRPDSALPVGIILEAALLILVVVVLVLQRKWVVTTTRKMGLFTIFLGLCAHILSYTSTSYIHIRGWYWASEMLFTILCLGILLECTYLTLKRFRIKPYVWGAVMVLLSLIVLASFGKMVLKRFPYSVSPEHQEDYLAGIHPLEALTEPGALIGSTGGGRIGYFIKDRTVVNLDGLINSPEYFQYLRLGRGAVYLDRMGLEYVIGNKYMLTNSDPYAGLFNGHLEEITNIDDLTLFRYIPSPEGTQ